MYAIVNINGTQVRATPDAVLEVPRLVGEPGQALEFGEVLLLADGDKVSVGRPYLPNAKVSAEIVEHFRGPKIRIFTYKATKDSKKSKGYRSDLTRIRVASIKA
jgi:large subunit ribosomal protein L21